MTIFLEILISSIFIFRYDSKFLNYLFKSLIIICLIAFCTKQFLRIYKNFNTSDIWPGIYSFLPNKVDFDPKEIVLSNKFKIYTKNKECMYNKYNFSPCTNNFTNILRHKKINSYDIIFLED